jgi:uncharacterized membrane protein
MTVEHAIARLLTLGTYVGVAALAIGLVLMMASGISPLDRPYPPLDVAAIPAGLVSLQPDAYLWAGLLVVISTPPARVAAALVGYVTTGERAMALVSVGILVVIAAAVVIGAAEG